MRKMLCSLGLILLPAFAGAQGTGTQGVTTEPGSSQTISDIRRLYRMHAGPFYANPTVLLKELGMDTNVFNQESERKSDFTFTVTPQADVAVPLARRALIRATVGTDLVYYATYRSERSVNPLLVFRSEVYIRRLTLFAQDGYVNTRQRPNYEIDVRSRHLQNDLTGGVSIQLSPKTALDLAAQRGRTRFDGDVLFFGNSLATTLNRDSSGPLVTLRHRLTPLTSVAVKFERLEDRFPLAPVRNTDSFRVMPGVELKPRALIKGYAYLGYRSFSPRDEALPNYAGLVTQVGLSYTLLGATTFGVTFDRDLAFSFETDWPYYVDNSVGAFVRRAVGGKWDVLVSAARHPYAYRAMSRESAPVSSVRRDVTKDYGISLGYRLKRDIRVGVGASYYTRSSDIAVFRDYNGLRIGSNVSYGF